MAKRPNEAATTANASALALCQEWFGHLARNIANAAGRPLTFLCALAVVVVWAALGPLFDYSDTWQLVINTGTTIVTFLMVFLIQNTQNRDTMALQIKLAELITVMQGAKNKLATAEDMTDEELEKLHEHYQEQAEHTLQHLSSRRKSSGGKPSAIGAESRKKA